MPSQDVTAELFYGGVWNEVPVYARNPITITRGYGDEQSDPSPSTASLTIDDRTQQYNPKNPTSPLYGLAGRNTPLRIVHAVGGGRFYGEVSSYKPGRTVGFDPDNDRGDAWVEIEASGVLRRLGQGADALPSVLRSYIDAQPGVLSYFPMEDGTTATAPGNAAANGLPAVVNDVTFGTDDELPASSGVLTFNSALSSLAASMPVSTATSFITAVMLFKLDAVPVSTMELFQVTATGSATLMTVTMNATSFGRNVYGPTGATLLSSGVVFGLDPTEWVALHFGLFQSSPGTITWAFYRHQVGDTTPSGATGTFSGTLGRATGISIAADAALAGAKFAHIVVTNDAFPFASQGMVRVVEAFTGETAVERLDRLCGDAGVTFTFDGADDSMPMGPQRPATVVGQFVQCEATDVGLLSEPRSSLGLHYRPRTDLYNQAPALTLDWSAFEVAEPFEPVLDDLATRNDVTATRVAGGSARAVLEDGPLSVLPPPDGVGRYATQVDVNPETDDELPGLASWLMRKGTLDEIRYTRVTVEDTDDAPDLMAAAAEVDIGDRLAVANLPAGISPNEASVIGLGYTEVIEADARRITFNCAPAEAYRVGVWDDAYSTNRGTFDATSESWAGETGVVVARVTSPVHDGAGSLRATKTMSSGFDSMRFNDAQGLRDLSAAGPLLLVWAQVPAGAAGSAWAAHIELQDAGFTWRAGPNTVLTKGTWAQLAYEPPADLLAACRSIGIQFEATGVNGSQAVYIDTVRQVAPTSTRWDSAHTIRPGVTPISSTQTSITLDTPTGLLWTMSSAHFPFDIGVGGERMRVTSIAPDTGTRQIFDVERSINGVVKSHPAGASVRLWKPARWAL